MKLATFEIFSVLVILFNSSPVCYCVAANKSQERSLSDNYAALTDDVKWFFRGISKTAGTVEQMLPNVTTNMAKTRSFSENTRITFLIGLRHLLVGIREIAMTFEQNFKTDHIKQLNQLKNATVFLNELIRAIKMWFTNIRAIVVHLVNVYNRYIPEVLFGRCLGNYLVTAYPERYFYEYPFILLTEIFLSVKSTAASYTESTEISTELPTFDPDLNMEQNEIYQGDDYNTFNNSKSINKLVDSTTESASSLRNFFDFSTVLYENKDKIIENAVNQESWQICFKLYTAESISRSLKTYFLGL